jgi:hypothetical protein
MNPSLLANLRSLTWLFYSLWGSILAISIHDGLLVVANRHMILEHERNPAGLLLLQLAGGEVWLLVAAKTLGTIAAGAALLLIFWVRPRFGWAACIALAALQFVLLAFLSFG